MLKIILKHIKNLITSIIKAFLIVLMMFVFLMVYSVYLKNHETDPAERYFYSQIEQKKIDSIGIMPLEDLTDFDWDSVCVLMPYSDKYKKIHKTKEFRFKKMLFSNDNDGAWILAFLKNGELIEMIRKRYNYRFSADQDIKCVDSLTLSINEKNIDLIAKKMTKEQKEGLDTFSNTNQRDIYQRFQDIPEILLSGIASNTYKERYMQHHLNSVRMRAKNKLFLTEEDKQTELDQRIQNSKKHQYERKSQFDLNKDEKITKEELTEYHRKNTNRVIYAHNDDYGLTSKRKVSESQINGMVNNFMVRFDKDKDDIVTKEELDQLVSKSIKNDKEYIEKIYYKLSKLDINNDGKIAVSEMDMLANKAFNTYDRNGDTIITNDEHIVYIEKKKNTHHPPRDCLLPALKDGTSFQYIQIDSGTGHVDVTTTGQESLTKLETIQISNDTSPLYLILNSYPTIWEFRGNTDAVEHIVISGKYNNLGHLNKRKPQSAVVSIPKEKISFLTNNCIKPIRGEDTELTIKSINKMIDIEPKIYKGGGIVSINKEITEFSGRRPVSMSGEVNKIDPKEVVSFYGAEKYEIIPGDIGIGKLIEDGSIIETRIKTIVKDRNLTYEEIDKDKEFVSRETEGSPILSLLPSYKIVKSIARYPVTKQKVSYIIADGVEPPKGSAGRSCAFSEKTRELIAGSKGSCGL